MILSLVIGHWQLKGAWLLISITGCAVGDFLHGVASGDPLQNAVTIVRVISQYRTDRDLQLLHQRLPFICVWDDREITNDTWREGANNMISSVRSNARAITGAGAVV